MSRHDVSGMRPDPVMQASAIDPAAFSGTSQVPLVPHPGKAGLPPLAISMAGDSAHRLPRSVELRGANVCRGDPRWQQHRSRYQDPGRPYFIDTATGQRQWGSPPRSGQSSRRSSLGDSSAGSSGVNLPVYTSGSFPGYTGAIGHMAPGASQNRKLSTNSGDIGSLVGDPRWQVGPAGTIASRDTVANRRNPCDATRYMQLAAVASQGRTEAASPARQSVGPSGAALFSWHD